MCAKLITPPHAFCGCQALPESTFTLTPERVRDLAEAQDIYSLTMQEHKELCELALIGLSLIEGGNRG
jgi:hypothetical protein